MIWLYSVNGGSMKRTSKATPDGFAGPSVLPTDGQQRDDWQAANRNYWQGNPMRYDWNQSIGHPEHSREFYAEIDRRFFTDAAAYLPWREIPFDGLIDFERLRSQDVLEIGVGNGSHAALLASRAKSFTGIDLTGYAVTSTSRRLELAGLSGTVLQMDAENLKFPDRSFDFVWSWGVIHHSADTGRILAEIARVLRPGGTAITMVYHRSLWSYYLIGSLVHGVARGGFLKSRSLHEVVQASTDGAIARYYSRDDWRGFASKYLDVDWIRIYGSKMELLPIPASRFKNRLAQAIPSSVGRFFTNSCGLGTFLVSRMKVRS